MRWIVLMWMCLLTGCAQVATSGAQALYNHQSLQKSATDQYMTVRSYQALDIDSDHFKNANVNVATLNRVVVLSGQVPEAWQKTEAELLIRKVTNPEELYNYIQIEQPSTQLTRAHDAWVTTKIKSKLFVASDIDATQVKVVTENGTVFLIGILKPEEADIAVNVAKSTSGVKEIVKVFSYIKITKVPV
jgi:osmotically-inducible protein OsmY